MENVRLRIRIPKPLYESVRKQQQKLEESKNPKSAVRVRLKKNTKTSQ
jgi:hypothetical protein